MGGGADPPRREGTVPALIATAALLAAAATAEGEGAAEARCRYLQAVARSEQALLFSPELFATTGLARVDVGDAPAGGAPVTATRPRIIAGLQMDASKVRRGLAAGRLADAACDLAAAEEELARFEVSGEAIADGPAIAARETTLTAALPEAVAILERTRRAVEEGRATIEELQATELRVSRLREALAAAARARAALRPAPGLAAGELRAHLAALAESEQAILRAEGDIRAASALSLSLRAGVDRVIDDARAEGFPAFGTLTVTWIPGGLWQPSAEADAARGLAAWSERSVTGASDRLRARLEALRARADVDRARLEEARVLLRDLERRHGELAEMKGDRVASFRDALQFELVAARAEVASLEASLQALERFLGAS